MKHKSLLIFFIFLLSFFGATFSDAQGVVDAEVAVGEVKVMEVSEGPDYLDCGHCDPNWTPDLEGCSPKTGCVVDIDTQLKYLPYYGIPEIAASLPASYWAGFGSLLVLLFLAIFLKR